MVLNENLDWAQVGALPTGSGTVRDAFRLDSGPPTKELLPIGMALYKFSSDADLVRGPVSDQSRLSPWWSPLEPFKHDGGLEARRSCAKAVGVSFREWGRLTSAIQEDWSSMAYLQFVVLRKPVYAWHGDFAAMSRVGIAADSRLDPLREGRGSSRNLPGGGTQFYIPNLALLHVDRLEHKPA